ncbi:hypothetical protein I2486_03320 [Cellulophaga sp. E16_2]|uniref:hypothetical protein n=1 Tax=Cellulophaga sp. E16_2 TaxID=2789297 RepID=UPI001A91B27D|nr:hypothetical protein [Cellulophaga sp. E16_2]MBO0590428.1 hypothetical protein [Cellulophaga sp. E16_2]
MKKLNIYIIALTCLTLTISCDNDPATVEQVLDNKTSGGILRTLDSSGSFDLFRTENTFAVTLEEQDETEGALIDRVDITVDFVDNNKTGSTGDDTTLGIAFGAIPASSFTTGSRNLPTADFSYTMEEALTAMGISILDVLPDDVITINLELLFTDGRSFSAADAAVTVTGGSFFSSPFTYSLIIDDGINFGKKGLFPKEINLVPGEVIDPYSVNLSIADGEGGDLIKTVNIYRRFRDLTIGEDGTNLSEDEALYTSIEVSTMTLDIDPEDEEDPGTRTINFEISVSELLGPDLSVEALDLGDEFQIRYELITQDGRIITTDESGTEYFDLIPTTECIQLNRDAPVAGEYTIEFEDLFGDGWDGAFITVEIDGASQDYTLETGSSGETKFTVPEGTSTLILTYNSGSFEEEHQYVILDPNENSAFSDGPEPNIGIIPIKICQPEQ